MVTKLEKDITRESSVQVDDREVMVTLTADQKISLKLKGLRSGALEISIEDLYDMLGGSDKPKKRMDVKPTNKNPAILLNDLRSKSAIAQLPYEMKSKFDAIILDLIKKENGK